MPDVLAAPVLVPNFQLKNTIKIFRYFLAETFNILKTFLKLLRLFFSVHSRPDLAFDLVELFRGELFVAFE